MSSNKKSKVKTLSEKVAESFTPRPLFDPESENSDDDTKVKIATLDEDDGKFVKSSDGKLSDFRKKNVKLLSEQSDKYKGVITSRKELEMEEEDSESDDENIVNEDSGSDESKNEEKSSTSEADDDLEQYRRRLKNCQIKDEDKDESFSTDEEDEEADMEQDGSESNAEDDSDYGSSSEELPEEQGESSKLISVDNKNDGIQKGLAVQNQLKMWEKLLEIRIHSQKYLQKANSLPLPETFKTFREQNDDFRKASEETSKNCQNLLENMLEMQTLLLRQYPETKEITKISKKRQSSSVNQDGNQDPPIKKIALNLEDHFEKFTPYRNSVLQKWDDRTKILTPGAGSKSKSLADSFDIIKKLETILLNKSDLIKRSQTVKGNYTIFGQHPEAAEGSEVAEGSDENLVKKEEIICADVYDDTDFYHQQLRELIEFKTNTSANPNEITKQFAELQKLRQKMKKKVDTRASKGRKIRYVVHNKLVNFMAPDENSEWAEDSKNALFKSLFQV